MKIKNKVIRALIFTVCAATVLWANTVSAATITVRSNADSGGTCPGTTCTLRQAISAAQPNDTIDFDMTTVTSPITLSTELVIDKALTISGPGASALTVSGNNAVRVFRIQFVSFANTVTISGLTIANGNAPGGGGIYHEGGILNLTNCVISNNSAINGGGGILNGDLSNSRSGTLNITNSTISNNSSGFQGGGILNNLGTVNVTGSIVSGNTVNSGSERSGGGICNFDEFNITNSTVSNNSATFGGGAYTSGFALNVIGSTVSDNTSSQGGGIFVDTGRLRIINSTVSGNSATGGDGGGVQSETGQVNIVNSTISANAAAGAGGGVILQSSGSITVKNTIIAGNSSQTAGHNDVTGTFVSQGYNLIGKIGGATGFTHGANNDQVGTDDTPLDPMLGALANNGGPTMTHALLSGSPAIDKGAAATNPINNQPITVDQRGFARPVDNSSITNATGGNGSDIGAYEVQLTTAASVTIKGRLLTVNGRGIAKALVRLTESDGTVRTVSTGAFGYYRFADVAAGQTVILEVLSKRFDFQESVRVINVTEEISDADFVAFP